MRIARALATEAVGAGFYTDLEAVRQGAAKPDGLMYPGKPITPGFRSVRQVAGGVAILLVLEDGEVAHGDGIGVLYSGRMGRDSLLIPSEQIERFHREVAPLLEGRELTGFRALAEEFDRLEIDGRRLHTALRYGLTQALLDAVARAQRRTMAEVVAEEWGLPWPDAIVPLNLQTASDPYNGVDRIILLRGPFIHTGSLYNLDLFRAQPEYVTWLRDRLNRYGSEAYRPTLHLDCYGHVGLGFDHDIGRMTDYLARLESIAAPYPLLIEDPVNMGEKRLQIEVMAALRASVRAAGLKTQLMVDELCPRLEDHQEFVAAGAADYQKIKSPDLGGLTNTIDGVLFLKRSGVGAYLGGSASETVRAAQIKVHLGMATRPDQMLASPGMGVNEAYSLAYCEMQRVRALLGTRRPSGG